MTHPTHGLDPNALEAAESAYAAATMDLPHHDCEDCGGSGVVTTGRGKMAGGDSCSTCGGGGVVVDLPDGWNPMASAIAAYLAALSQNPGTSNTSGDAVAISVKTMKLSDGREDHYVSIRVGDREITPHKYSIKGRAEFDVAEWNWLLNGAEKPDVVDWLDRTRPLAALEPRASDREAIEPWQEGERELALRWITGLHAELSSKPDHADDCLWLQRLHDIISAAIRKLSEVSHEH